MDTAIGERLVTKADLEIAIQPLVTRAELDAALDAALQPMASKADLAALEQRITMRLGTLVVAGIGLLAVFQKIL